MKHIHLALASLVLVSGGLAAFAVACSSTTNTNVVSDAGTASDSSMASDSLMAQDEGPFQDEGPRPEIDSGTAEGGSACGPTYAACTAADYVDFSAMDGGTIQFGGALGLKYLPNCVKIKAGQSLTWTGDFGTHPLNAAPCNPTSGGTIPTGSGTTPATATFTTAGYYGYYCSNHGGPTGNGMAGNIQVE